MFHRIKDQYYEVKIGIRNLWVFRKAVWDFSDADFDSFLKLMEVSALEVSAHLTKHDMKVGDAREAKRLRVVANLCRRLIDEEIYYQDPYFKSRNKYSQIRARYDYDLYYLRHLLKYMPRWWC